MFYTEVRTKAETREQILKTLQGINEISFVGESTEDPDLLVVHFDTSLEEDKIIKLKESLSDIKNVVEVGDMSKGTTIAAIHCFFDIDGTLTDPERSHIGTKVRQIFERYRKANIFIYFSTGRSIEDVRNLIGYFSPLVEKYAIAENGGVLIDPTHKDGIEKFGNTKTEPQRFYNYIRKNHPLVREDDDQRNRETEMIILQGDITSEEMTVLKTQAYYDDLIKVEVLRGGSTYHITPKGVNKGSMIAKWVNKRQLSLELNKIVSAGDTELDISMFEESQISYLMGTAAGWLKALVGELRKSGILKTTTVLQGTFLENLEKIYCDMAVLTR
jgi:HAD superfamily hydrolase (TIGR01484 family)